MKIENVITFTKQFNKEFGSKIKISNKNIPLLLNMFNEYIEQTFKTSDVYKEILDKIEKKLDKTIQNIEWICYNAERKSYLY